MDTTHDPIKRFSAYHSGDPHKVGLWADGGGHWVTYVDHVEAVRQAEQRGRDEARLSNAKSVRRIRVDERKKVLDYLRTHNRSETIDYLVGL